MRSAVFASLVLALSLPVAAGAAETAVADTAKPKKEKKICKLLDGQTSSRMRKRICRTAEEWDNAAQNKIDTTDLRRMGAN